MIPRRTPVAAHGRYGLVKIVQPPKNVGDAVADLPSDANAGWAAAIGTQVVDRLHVHAEIRGELARREYGLQTEPRETCSIHNP